MLYVLGLVVALAILIAPWWAIAEARRTRREQRALLDRLDALERQLLPRFSRAAEAPEMVEEPIPPPTEAPPVAAISPLPSPPPAPVLAPVAAPARTFDSSRAEELIGSVWLQNVGAVLLLLGVFFLILWGYTNGRIGPEVLVGAGVALGATVVWRGDRMARRLPLFGHALIGVGLGIAYLSLYLGHFTLHVLPPWAAFTLIALLSIASVVVGLHYGVQTIAVLGVVGAFVPQLMATWIPLHGFSMSPGGLLAYMASIDAVVFVLAIRAGWSALAVAALLLTSVTWIAGVWPATWSWGVEAGLAALFTALGLSPVPWLVRKSESIPAADLAVVALAPLALVACSWPLLANADRTPVAILLLVLAIVHLVVALWVDARRERQELWRPLTGAAIVFVSVALERMLGRERTPMAWCIEGTLLLWIGLRPRGAWLRLCGSAVTALGVVWMLAGLFSPAGWTTSDLPVFYAAGLRDLVCIVAVLAGAALIGRARDQLGPLERLLGNGWTAAGNVVLAAWICREASHVAASIETPGGRWYTIPEAGAALADARQSALTFALTGAAWLAQAWTLVETGLRGRTFLRVAGYVLALVATFTLFLGMQMADYWRPDQLPIVNAIALLRVAGVIALYTIAARAAAVRERLGAQEQSIPEIWTVIASLTMLAWSAAEADHLARYVSGAPGRWVTRTGLSIVTHREAMQRVRMLTAAFTSAGWLIEAIALLVTGWFRDSAFLRWLSLGLFGLTVLKFLLVDLQTVDIFWRFLTALVVGAALLAVSYAYQRRTRDQRKAA